MKELMKLAHRIAKAIKKKHDTYTYATCLRYALKLAWHVIKRTDKKNERYDIIIFDKVYANANIHISNYMISGQYGTIGSAEGGVEFFPFENRCINECAVVYSARVSVTLLRSHGSTIVIKINKGSYHYAVEQWINTYFCCYKHGKHVYYPDTLYDELPTALYNALVNRDFIVTVGKGVQI